MVDSRDNSVPRATPQNEPLGIPDAGRGGQRTDRIGRSACDGGHVAVSNPARTPSGEAAPAEEHRDRALMEERYALHPRFDRMGRLLGDENLKLLFHSHAMVVGLGGVGSFAAESMARSGFGRLTVVDFDRVCVTNTNRQLQALSTTVGRPKAAVLAERLAAINPQLRVEPLERFYSESVADQILQLVPNVVVDAIDNLTAKCHLLAECRRRRIPVISSMGAAGKMDPTAIAADDLACSKRDPMARSIRKILRQKHEFPRHGPFGITAVYSTELPKEPLDLHYDEGCGPPYACPGGKNDIHTGERRRVIYGSASFVTGAFGLVCAARAVTELLALRESSS